jgi:hypothetical protein
MGLDPDQTALAPRRPRRVLGDARQRFVLAGDVAELLADFGIAAGFGDLAHLVRAIAVELSLRPAEGRRRW